MLILFIISIPVICQDRKKQNFDIIKDVKERRKLREELSHGFLKI
jgi:hypothetical protein